MRSNASDSNPAGDGGPISLGVLVIGYGNELRCDDALGPHLARAIAAWNLPGVTVLVRQQLLPELAEALAGSDLVFFLDAHLDSSISEVSVTRMHAGPQEFRGGHLSDPQGLLAWCAALHGRAPQAWWVRVRAEDIGFGMGLSVEGCRRAEQALGRIRPLLEGRAPARPAPSQSLQLASQELRPPSLRCRFMEMGGQQNA